MMGNSDTTRNLPAEYTLPPSWRLSDRGLEGIRLATGMAKTKHGLYASVPIVCKGERCPYINTCALDLYGLVPEGERCPVEIAEVIKMFEEYVTELGIDPESRVDLGLLKELIDIEVTLMRADHMIADDPAIIKDIDVAINDRGQRITRPEIHKAYDLKDKLNKRKHEILRLLNSTRKDKASDLERILDPSTYAAELIKRARANAIDADFEVVDDVGTGDIPAIPDGIGSLTDDEEGS